MTETTELRSRWKALVKRFPAWRFLFDLVFDASSWRLFGADLTGLVMDNRNARLAARALEGASADTLESLASIAEVNVSRTGDVFKAVFLGYVSLPLAFGALLSDAAPDALRSIIADNAASIVIFLFGAIVFPVVYFCGNWRAKQIAWVIDLYRAGALKPK
jgi:hypothetical protein